MSGVSSADGGSFYGAEVRLGDQDMAAGRVSFGGVSISATDAAEFVMMHRTEVLKQVGADRTELAEKHLADIRKARRYINDLSELKKFAEGDSYHGRAPVTPDMISFLKNQVGCSPGEYRNRVVFYGSMAKELPESVRKYYGFTSGWEDNAAKSSDDPPEKGIQQVDGFGMSGHHNQFQLHGATVLYKGDIDTIKEELNNYIDQLNDSNNLFMTKFKNVVNTMNEALDGANSMADKSHDTVKNLVSRW